MMDEARPPGTGKRLHENDEDGAGRNDKEPKKDKKDKKDKKEKSAKKAK